MELGDRALWEKLFGSSGVRLVMQSEVAECSVACLCMVASHYGQNRTLSELRRIFSVSMKGATFQSLMEMADAIGLSGRPLRAEIHELIDLKTPCILHWDLRHYVVLTKATRSYVEINDPARGRRRLSISEASKSFTGVAMEFTPTPRFEKKKRREKVHLSDMWTSMHGVSGFIVQLALLALTVQVLATIGPIFNQMITDDAIARGDRGFLFTVSTGMILVILLQYCVGFLQGLVGLYLGTQLSFQMKSNLLRHALRLPVAWFEKRHLGEILTRFSSLEVVQNFVTDVPVRLALNLLMLVTALTMMVFYSPFLSVIVIVSSFLLLFIRAASVPYVNRKTDESLTLGAQASTVFMETLRGARTFKQYGKERERVSYWQNDQILAMNVSFVLSRFNLFSDTIWRIVLAIQTVLIWYFGARDVIDGAMSLGMLLAFQSFVGQISTAMTTLIGIYQNWKTLGLHLDRLGDVIHEDIEPGADDPVNYSNILSGALSIRNIAFRYATTEQFLYKDVSLDIGEGEFIAIVGKSGGGKTTFLKNLMYLLPPSEGDVLVDGISIRAFGIRNFRHQIGIVMQDDQLFQGTIADNVSFFDAEADTDRIRWALQTACVFEDIQSMPMGMETLVGDLGSTLSGGQAQRILIARAIYREPKILFLDEGTSHLDPITEKQISANLRALKITRILVSHREAANEGADRTIRVEYGTVTEQSLT